MTKLINVMGMAMKFEHKYKIERLKNKMKYFKWPLVTRRTYDALEERRVAGVTSYMKEINQMKRDWDEKWQPLLDKCKSLNVRVDDTLRSYAIVVKLSEDMVNHVAGYNNQDYWRFVANRLAQDFEMQLARLNFTGLHKLALDNEYELRRHRTMPVAPSW